MGPGGTLRMVFEADAWDSTISFAPGIPVTLGGTLELTFADDVNLASQVGRTFDLFDWTGVNPTGAFAVSSPYAWDLSNLYTTGEVTLTAVPEPSTLLLLSCCASGDSCDAPCQLHRRSRVLQIAAAMFPLVAFAARRTGRHLSVGVHQPGRPQPRQAAKHDARPRRRRRRCRARRRLIEPQPDDGLSDWRGFDRRQWRFRESDQCRSEPGEPHQCDPFAATLTDADFTGADVRGAKFDRRTCDLVASCRPYGTGITLAAALLHRQLPGP